MGIRASDPGSDLSFVIQASAAPCLGQKQEAAGCARGLKVVERLGAVRSLGSDPAVGSGADSPPLLLAFPRQAANPSLTEGGGKGLGQKPKQEKGMLAAAGACCKPYTKGSQMPSVRLQVLLEALVSSLCHSSLL